MNSSSATVRTGLDRLLTSPEELSGRRWALLAHSAAVSVHAEPIVLALVAAGVEMPDFLLSPEHGFYGVEQDMVPSEDAEDPWTGTPIRSLYGDSPESLRPEPGVFADVDLLVIDLQDVGSRYYTYAATGVWAAEAAIEAGCEVWVLDRPNPLGGLVVEGNRRQPGFESFIGAFEHPVRHGLTMGELTRMELGRSGRLRREAGLRVWEMEGWTRDMTWAETGRPWIAPSPNMPTPETAAVYPGGCLIEATEVSEGRGTTRPFELIGAPWIDPPALAAALTRDSLAGQTFTPTYFRPQFQKHAAEACGGVQWIGPRNGASGAYRAGVEIVRALYVLGEDEFSWRRAPYEFEIDRPAIDLLTGDDIFRKALEEGHELNEWLATWEADEESFREERRPFLLYPEPSE